MNHCCYVSHSPVSCSATDGKRDRGRESAWRASCVPCCLTSVHDTQNHTAEKGKCSFPLTALTFPLTALTSAEGQRRRGISPRRGPASSSYLRSRGPQEVQPGPLCCGSLWQQNSDRSRHLFAAWLALTTTSSSSSSSSLDTLSHPSPYKPT